MDRYGKNKDNKDISEKMDDYILSNGKRLLRNLIIGIVAIVLILGSFTIIPGGERGVIFSKVSGVQEHVLDEGFHFKKPIIDKIIKLEVRTTKFDLPTDSTSQDQQIVQATVVLNYNLNPETVNKLYQEVGKDYINRIIRPAVEGSIKSIMAQFKAEDLIQKRSEVTSAIKEDIKTKLDTRYFNIVDLNLVKIDFSEKYDQAIEAKVTAEQDALRARNELEKTKIEKEKTIVEAEAEKQKVILEAEGEAEALRIKQEAAKNSKEVIQLKWIETWDGALPKYYGANDNLMLLINQS